MTCWNLFYHFLRYKREFGFTIPSRSIMVDDIRIRAVAKVMVHKQVAMAKASNPPEAETVSGIIGVPSNRYLRSYSSAEFEDL